MKKSGKNFSSLRRSSAERPRPTQIVRALSLPVQPVRHYLYGTRCNSEYEDEIKHAVTATCADMSIPESDLCVYVDLGAPYPDTSSPLVVNIYTYKVLNVDLTCKLQQALTHALALYKYVPQTRSHADCTFSPPPPL